MLQAEALLGLFPDFFREIWKRSAERVTELQEIRLRADKPVILLLGRGEYFLGRDGAITDREERAFSISRKELDAVLQHMCRYSLYAFEEELRQGFLTLPGGHRVGVAGQAVLGEQGGIIRMKQIGYLNIRIAHEIPGAADSLLPFLYQDGQLLSSMIISPPGCGKTTLLRDIVRQVSNGNAYGRGQSVGVVDERSEIAGSYMGSPQNDLGIRTDVLDGCPKAAGMMMLIRSMSPRVVAADEIGSIADVQALLQVLCCGSRLLVTVHGSRMEELCQKSYMAELLEQKEFKRFILLDGKGRGTVKGIFDQEYMPCC